MEEEYGRFFLSNYRGALLHFGPDELQEEIGPTDAEDDLSPKEDLCGEVFSAQKQVDPSENGLQEEAILADVADVPRDPEVPEATDPLPPEPRKPRIELPPLPPEPAQPGPSGQGKRGSVDPQELERRLQNLAKPESEKDDPSPKQLRFSEVEEIEPPSQDPSFPELPHVVAAAAAATVTQDLADSRAETRVQDGFPERSPRGARPIEIGKLPATETSSSAVSVMEMDEEVARNIDDFFSRDEAWRQLAHCDLRSQELMMRIQELPVVSRASKFKVTVPKPYPGVQYRRSKHLEERYSRFAENGAIVVGQLEADSANGEWLRISGNIFLPVRVGQIHILDEVIDPPVSHTAPGPDPTAQEAWWTCCPSNAETDCGKALEQAAQPMRPERHPQQFN